MAGLLGPGIFPNSFEPHPYSTQVSVVHLDHGVVHSLIVFCQFLTEEDISASEELHIK